MAITIIKGGKNEFVGHCKWCGCDFRYTADDVTKTTDEVFCPQDGCGRSLKHCGENGTSSVAPSLGWFPFSGYQQSVGSANSYAYAQQVAMIQQARQEMKKGEGR